MNMAGMNPAMAGGPVGGGGMMGMNNGSPATQQPQSMSPDQLKMSLNGYIYEYLLKMGHYDLARAVVRDEKFDFRTNKGPIKQSPGRKKDGEINGMDGDSMEMDLKDDIPDDLPRPNPESSLPGSGFLLEWFSIFHDLYAAHRGKGPGGNMGAAAQYLMQHQNMQRMRENQQNPNLARPGAMNPNQYAMRGMKNGMVNGKLGASMTPQQLQQIQVRQQQMLQQQQAMQREQADAEMNGRPSTPIEGENGGSPSKRPRLENPQFNGAMMANGRPGMPGVAPQGMMIQSGFNPNMGPRGQFQPNGGMPQKPMQPGMPNGMINMNNAGSPMMAGMNPAQFGGDMAMDMYNSARMGGQPGMQGPPGTQSGNHALQDYQMQLMLLEQQNKKRLMMARQEQDNAVNRDGAPMPVGMGGTGMSPTGSRSGTSPNPTDQMKRTPQLAGGLPGSPSAGENMQGRSPAAMGFMNGMPTGDFNPAMFMQDKSMMGSVGPNMRPPTSAEMGMARQQGRMINQFQGGQPMVQQPSQGQQQPMGTPGQRNEMPPPQAPATNSAQRNQPASPAQSGNAPPTPSQANRPNPKGKKGKEDSNKKRPQKKNSSANAPVADNEPPATPTPSTPITPQHANSFNTSGGKGPNPNMPNANQSQQPVQPMPQQQQLQQPDISQSNAFSDAFNGPDQNFNLDFSTLENTDVLENFDFDSFLNTTNDDTFNFDGTGMVGGDFSLDATGD